MLDDKNISCEDFEERMEENYASNQKFFYWVLEKHKIRNTC